MPTETDALVHFLDRQRKRALGNVDGLSDDALRQPVLPSGWNCVGLFQHLTVNERYWLRWAVGGEQITGTDIVNGQCQVVLDDMADVDNDWLVAPHLTPEAVIGRYRAEAELANLAIADVTLDGPPRQSDPPWSEWFSSTIDVRWILLHMIEETAQHAGHLDVVREILDDRKASASP